MLKENIFMAAEQAGFKRIESCCGVPLKTCGQDEWKGDIGAFARCLLRLAGLTEDEICHGELRPDSRTTGKDSMK